MKKIRLNSFETNSSSTHTLCLLEKGFDKSNPHIKLSNQYLNTNDYVVDFNNNKTLLIYQDDFSSRSEYRLVDDSKVKIKYFSQLLQVIKSRLIYYDDLDIVYNRNFTRKELCNIYNHLESNLLEYVQMEYGEDIEDFVSIYTEDSHFEIDLLFDIMNMNSTVEEINDIIDEILFNQNIVIFVHSDENDFPEEKFDNIKEISSEEVLKIRNSK